MNLNYFEHFLIFISAISDCVPISVFTSSFGILVGIARASGGLKSCAKTAEIKKCNSVIKKKEKYDDKIV